MGILPKASDYNDGLSENKLGREFDLVIKNLEDERFRFYKKTKGLFKRSFFRTVLVLSTLFILIGGSIQNWEDPVGYIVGPIVMSMFIGLIGGGIYTVIRKGTNNHKFSRILKEKLVSKLVSHVNPNFSYFDEGIKEEDFDKADLFPSAKNTSLRSEDKITGTMDGKKVCIAECMKNGSAAATQGSTEINYKGKTISVDREHLKTNNGEFVTYFNGLFLELELGGYDFSSPLKFVPHSKIGKRVDTGINFVGHVQKFVNIDEADKIALAEEHVFQVFSKDKSEAESKMDDNLLKIADSFFDKYNIEGTKLMGDIPVIGKLPFFKDVNVSKSVFLSFYSGKMYLALEWPRDMFETDVFLKKSLVESNIAQTMYEDILFINQLVSEMSILNKMNA